MREPIDQKTKITVIMSVHNGEKYIKEAVESILKQSYKNFEFIIIDDASTDDTSRLLQAYEDPRIVLVKNEGRVGLTKSLNSGLKMANGEYVARMDADDIAMHNRLQVQKDFLDTNSEIAVVGAGTEIINNNGETVGRKNFLQNAELISFLTLTANQVAHPAVMYRKLVVLERCGGYNENFTYIQDYELWSRVIEMGYKISNLPQVLLKYRYHGESVTQATQSKEEAYKLVVKVIRRNMNRYITFTNEEFDAFISALHYHKVDSVKNIISSLELWSRLEKSYLQKKEVSAENRKRIHNYTRSRKVRVFQWYAKKRLGIVYKIFTKIWKPL